MERAIDKQTMLDLIIEAKRTDPETGSFAEWLAEYLVEHLPTLTPPNEPLTLEQLREMDGEPAYVVSAIGERSEWYIVDLEENELKNPWDRIALDNWDERYPYTAYRRPPDGKETIK